MSNPGKRRPYRNRPPYEDVARRYQELTADPTSRPAQTIAEEFGVPRATVRSWIFRCREVGLLPPHDDAAHAELRVFGALVTVMERLNPGEQRRALAYLNDRYGGDRG